MTAATSEPRRYAGQVVSPGRAAGLIYQGDTASEPAAQGPAARDEAAAARAATPAQVEAAFAAVASDRHELAGRLRAVGRADEADIVTVAALIAADQVLVTAAVAAVSAGTDAAAAVLQAGEDQGAVLAAIPSPELAERAADVRQVAAAVLEHLAGGHRDRPPGEIILVRRDVAAADLI